MILEYILKNKWVVWLTGGLVVLSISGALYYALAVFHVSGVSPSQGATIESLTKTVVVSFNKDLDGFDKSKQILSDNDIVAGARLDGRKLYIQLYHMESGNDYQITLLNITDTSGKVIPSYVYKFRYNYDATGKATSDDKNVDDPVIKNLPVTTNEYYITYKILDKPDSNGKTEKITIALLLSDQQLNNAALVRQYKQDALSFLNAKGIKLSNYQVEYSPEEVSRY